MAKKMLIDATHPEETRVVVVDGNKVEEFDFETINKRQIAGNIYLAKVTRVEPSLQAAFVDYGGNRHGFLAFAEIHPDYYQIPTADRQALIEEERQLARAEEEEENRRSRRRKPAPRAEQARPDAVVTSAEVVDGLPSEMAVIDLDDQDGGNADGGIAAYESEGAAPEAVPQAVAEHEAAAEAEAVEAPATEGSEASDTAESDDATDEANGTDPADEIESVGEEDVAEEISAPKRPRARRYKIQEVIKVRQIMLVQVVKEERGNKGAALTTYLSLAGRYCVLMPNTARGGGISRKITNAPDRKKLKEIAAELEVPEGAGLIIRTAGAKRTKPEIRRDYEYLMRLWEQIRDLTLRSIAPAAIYEEGDLIKRTIRDLYSRDIEEILVEGENGYRTAKDFMRMIMPAHAKQVKLYNEAIPLFARYQVESYLGGMFNPVVQLKSGGYIVIGVTEALVAIDVNSGRATKEGSIEETALKTNLEAAEEVARQARLRDLAGLIVIDFIDMEERKNNAAVEKRLKDKLKTDRARIQVGRISGFGLLEMSRQRLRPGMLEFTTQPCAHCHGTGLIRSDDSMALTILRALEEEGTRKRSKEVLLKAPVGIVNYLFNHKREHIALIESRYGMAVRMEADPSLVSPDYALEKFKTATRTVPETSAVISGHAGLMGDPVDEDLDEDLIDEVADEDEEEVRAEAAAPNGAAGREESAEAGENGDGSKKKRRRRRRRRGGAREEQSNVDEANAASAETSEGAGEDEGDAATDEPALSVVTPETASDAAAPVVEVAVEAASDAAPVAAAKPKRTRKPRTKAGAAEAAVAPVEGQSEPAAAEGDAAAPVAEAASVDAEAAEGDAAAKPAARKRSTRSTSKSKPAAEASEDGAPAAKPTRSRAPAKPKAAKAPKAETAPVAEAEQAAEATAPAEAHVPASAPAEAVAAPAVVAEPAAAVAEAPIAEAPVSDVAAAEASAPAAEEPARPRRKGWWNK